MVHKARKTLGDVHPDFTFKLVSGGELKNLNELLTALKNMDVKTFSHHVNDDKNDFANWVRDVLKDEELANAIDWCHDQVDMERIVKNKIIELQDKIQMHNDFASFASLLPVSDNNALQEDDERVESDDIKKIFDFKSLDDIKIRLHTIASGALFGLVVGLLLGYVFGKL